jgi:hypothetical protein
MCRLWKVQPTAKPKPYDVTTKELTALAPVSWMSYLLDDDRGNIGGRIGSSAETDADHAIGPPASDRRPYITFRERVVQDRTLGMFALILPQHRAQLIVW